MQLSTCWVVLALAAARTSALSGAARTPTQSRPFISTPDIRSSHPASPERPVILTREDGKNGKLASLLSKQGVPWEELPCIAFERLPGCATLEDALQQGGFDWCVITSPESATVFLDAWMASGSPSVRIASVGAGTAKVLSDAGLPPAFVPSKATAKTLAAELPVDSQEAAGGHQVVYPASAIASDTLETGLGERGVTIRRIDTYTTVPAKWASNDEERARDASVVTFASPSAVRVWAARVGTDALAVCIGETSAAEARRLGFGNVRFPASPGVVSWADEVIKLRK